MNKYRQDNTQLTASHRGTCGGSILGLHHEAGAQKLDGRMEDAETTGGGVGDIFAIIHSTGMRKLH